MMDRCSRSYLVSSHKGNAPGLIAVESFLGIVRGTLLGCE